MDDQIIPHYLVWLGHLVFQATEPIEKMICTRHMTDWIMSEQDDSATTFAVVDEIFTVVIDGNGASGSFKLVDKVNCIFCNA